MFYADGLDLSNRNDAAHNLLEVNMTKSLLLTVASSALALASSAGPAYPMHNFRRQSAVAAIALATSIFFTQTGFARTAEECRVIDCSGGQISCPGGNPLEKLLCEQRKATWKAKCELEKRVCFTTIN